MRVIYWLAERTTSFSKTLCSMKIIIGIIATKWQYPNSLSKVLGTPLNITEYTKLSPGCHTPRPTPVKSSSEHQRGRKLQRTHKWNVELAMRLSRTNSQMFLDGTKWALTWRTFQFMLRRSSFSRSLNPGDTSDMTSPFTLMRWIRTICDPIFLASLWKLSENTR